jgi:hypothetical protein
MSLDVPTQMATPQQCVRIAVPHAELDTGDADLDAYHQWIDIDQRVRADVNGKLAPRMNEAYWRKWICNNGDCPGIAYVHDDLARLALIDTAEQQ